MIRLGPYKILKFPRLSPYPCYKEQSLGLPGKAFVGYIPNK